MMDGIATEATRQAVAMLLKADPAADAGLGRGCWRFWARGRARCRRARRARCCGWWGGAGR